MEIKLGDIKKDNLEDIMPRLLQLEGNWEGIGEAPWTKDNFRLELPGKWKLSIYASYKNEIVGYMVCSISDKVGKINKIVVENGFRKKGIGTRLWDELLSRCREMGINSIEFKSSIDNPSAITFYKKKSCIFTGTAIGSDGKERNKNKYVIKAANNITHSKPTINISDIYGVAEVLKKGSLAEGNLV